MYHEYLLSILFKMIIITWRGNAFELFSSFLIVEYS